MLRKIIEIDSEKCNGCGLCVSACHEGAIQMVDGKAKLMRDDYCDGLGDCLAPCPVGAISFIDKDTLAYDEKAVNKNKQKSKSASTDCNDNVDKLPCGCPSTNEKTFDRTSNSADSNTNSGKLPCGCPSTNEKTFDRTSNSADSNTNSGKLPCGCPSTNEKKIDRNTQDNASKTCMEEPLYSPVQSQLSQFPIQLALVSPKAKFFENCDLLIAADCTAFAYGNFHNEFIKNRITLIACPKLDDNDYITKLSEILGTNNIKSITVVRMEVPCCGGIVSYVTEAMKLSQKIIPWQIVTISTDGEIL